MSKDEEIKKSQLPDMHPMGPGDPTDNEPVPDDSWYIESNPMFRGAEIIGVNYKGNVNGLQVGGKVSTGSATLQVKEGMTNVGLTYSNEHVSASVGYTVGSENANVTTTYDTNSGLAIGGKLKFGSTTVDFNQSSIGATYNFGGGITAGISGSMNGGLTVSFGGSNWGGGSGFSFSLGATNSGGSWSVDARFNLVFNEN